MPRTADYTIQGFLYQFHKTLLEVINSANDAQVTIEGIAEDIEIQNPLGVELIQCKYHEAQSTFTLSAIYKPLLQMMQHFHTNSSANVKYILFAYFPDESQVGSRALTKANLKTVLNSDNKELQKYIQNLKGQVDLDGFLSRFSLAFGPCLDDLIGDVCKALAAAGIDESDIDTLAYPNAINLIASISIKHDAKDRSITRPDLLDKLRKIKKTAISRWTLALKTRKQILDAKRKQLKPNLDKNTRLRYFVIHQDSLDDFDDDIVMFVSDYLDKYHFKSAHLSTPVLCLITTEEKFKDIQLRLFHKGIVVADGLIADHFDENHFYREPLGKKGPTGSLQREFHIRILRWESHATVLNQKKCDDLFILGDVNYSELDTKDINVEILAANNLKEIRYTLGVNNVYE